MNIAFAIGVISVLCGSFFYQSELESFYTKYVSPQFSSHPKVPSTINCQEKVAAFLTTVMPIKGFHVVCLNKISPLSYSGVGFIDGMNSSVPIDFALPSFNQNGGKLTPAEKLVKYRANLEKVLNIEFPHDDEYAVQYKQPWAMFSTDGIRLEHFHEMVNRVVFVFEGGQFIWPGIRIGHKTIVKNVTGFGEIEMETLSMTPLVFSVSHFLKDEEIKVVLDLSLQHLAPSGVTHSDGDEGKPATEWRTSTTYFLNSDSKKVQDIDQRTEDLVRVPKSHQEYVQVLRYEKTQKYDHHTDYFPVESLQNSPDVLKDIEYGFKNRMITVFWYMSDVEEGGHTIFPRSGGTPPITDFKDCSKGLKVKPQKGKVIIFYSMLPSGDVDPMSLHGGCPVEKGVKYSGNKWVWNKAR